MGSFTICHTFIKVSQCSASYCQNLAKQGRLLFTQLHCKLRGDSHQIRCPALRLLAAQTSVGSSESIHGRRTLCRIPWTSGSLEKQSIRKRIYSIATKFPALGDRNLMAADLKRTCSFKILSAREQKPLLLRINNLRVSSECKDTSQSYQTLRAE